MFFLPKLRDFIAFLLILLPAFAAHAEKLVFDFPPEQYALSYSETSKHKPTMNRTLITHVHGRYWRSESQEYGLIIKRPDLNRQFIFKVDGSMEDGLLPTQCGPPPLPKESHGWKFVGEDTVNGKPALKYYYTYKQYITQTAWLSPDKLTLLRFQKTVNKEKGVVEHYDYLTGPQDAKLFEVPGYPPPKF